MMRAKLIAAAGALTFVIASIVAGQTKESVEPATAPPKLVVLVYQRFAFDKGSEHDKWEVATARACQKLAVPNSWIVLDSVTGEPEVLSFDPFDSFAQMEKPIAEWGPIYASHPELGRLQAQIHSALASQRTVIAARRDDLSYRANRIDLSKARFMRVLEVRLHPGRENDFAEAFKSLSAAYEKTESDLPWVVYQVNAGTPSPTFLAFVPMRTLNENDSYLARAPKLLEAEGEVNADRMHQIARDAYESSESNLYAISPTTSHVPKEFADGDPDFWLLKQSSAVKPPASSVTAENSTQKRGEAQPKQ